MRRGTYDSASDPDAEGAACAEASARRLLRTMVVVWKRILKIVA